MSALTERLDLSEFTFDIPCDVLTRNPSPRPCDEPAEWALRARRHCHDEEVRILCCTTHKERAVQGCVWHCRACGQDAWSLDHLLGYERIRP